MHTTEPIPPSATTMLTKAQRAAIERAAKRFEEYDRFDRQVRSYRDQMKPRARRWAHMTLRDLIAAIAHIFCIKREVKTRHY